MSKRKHTGRFEGRSIADIPEYKAGWKPTQPGTESEEARWGQATVDLLAKEIEVDGSGVITVMRWGNLDLPLLSLEPPADFLADELADRFEVALTGLAVSRSKPLLAHVRMATRYAVSMLRNHGHDDAVIRTIGVTVEHPNESDDGSLHTDLVDELRASAAACSGTASENPSSEAIERLENSAFELLHKLGTSSWPSTVPSASPCPLSCGRAAQLLVYQKRAEFSARTNDTARLSESLLLLGMEFGMLICLNSQARAQAGNPENKSGHGAEHDERRLKEMAGLVIDKRISPAKAAARLGLAPEYARAFRKQYRLPSSEKCSICGRLFEPKQWPIAERCPSCRHRP